MTKIIERQIAVYAVLISILAITSVVVIISFPTRETYGIVVAAQQTPSKKILIVTHQGVIRVILAYLDRRPLSLVHEPQTGSRTTLEINVPEIRVLTFSDKTYSSK